MKTFMTSKAFMALNANIGEKHFKTDSYSSLCARMERIEDFVIERLRLKNITKPGNLAGRNYSVQL